jgi:hypothetical protein
MMDQDHQNAPSIAETQKNQDRVTLDLSTGFKGVSFGKLT